MQIPVQVSGSLDDDEEIVEVYETKSLINQFVSLEYLDLYVSVQLRHFSKICLILSFYLEIASYWFSFRFRNCR